MMKLSTFHRRLALSRRGRHFAAASCALAFAAGYSGRSHARPAGPSKGTSNPSVSSTAHPPMHAIPTAGGTGKLFRLQGVRVSSKLENGRLIVNGLTGTLGGGRVRAAGRVDAGDKTGAQQIQAQFDDVDVSEVLRLLDVHLDSAGVSPVRADGVVNLNWRGMDQNTVRRSLSGRATVKTGPGAISRNSPLLKRLGDAAGISNLEGLSFRSARIDAVAQGGVVRVRSLVFQGDQIRLSAAGTVNMRDEQIDLLMDVDVAPQLAERSRFYKLQGLASLFGKKKMEQTADGFVEVPRIALVGDLNSPEIRLDTAARADAEPQQTAAAKTPAVNPQPAAPPVARQVAQEAPSTETKRVPLWRNIVSNLSERPGRDPSADQ